jgi:hypothetical protein
MNLHSIISPYIGAVNPPQTVKVQISVGASGNSDATRTPVYATPGSLTASIGGTFTASIPDPVNNPTTLNVAAVLTGSLQAGDEISGTDGTNTLPAGTTIIEQLTGTPGSIGTYEISQSAVLNSCTVTSASTVLNVTAISQGVLQAGQTLADTTGGLTAGTLITGQLQGNAGASGLYSISQQQTVASETMTISMAITAQVQPLAASDLRHMDALNLQGSHRTLYASAPIRGIVRPALKGGDRITLPDESVWLVSQVMEPFFSTAGWQKVTITLQNSG